jgi:hypothetical protein
MANESSPKENISQFEKLLAGMSRAGIDFAVVGGVAVILNGFHRQTRDTDIIVHPSDENIERLLAYLRGWGEGWARELQMEDFRGLDEGSLRVTEDFTLDIFVKMRGKTLDDFRPGLRYLQSDDVRVPILSPEDLIHCKAESWRDKDKIDVQALREILRREQEDKQ